MARKPSEFVKHPVSFGRAQEVGLVRGVCRRVVDGDTYDFFIDLGFNQYAYHTIRLLDVDTPEPAPPIGWDWLPIFRPETEEERKLGRQAAERCRELMLNKPVLLRSYKDAQTFGRFVAEVYVPIPKDREAPTISDWNLSGGPWYGLGRILKHERLTKSDVPITE